MQATEEAAAPAADKPAEVVTSYRLRELVLYDAATGVFINRITRGRGAIAGSVAGWKHCAGYLSIRIDGRAYLCHRLAWLYVRGVWPIDQIDHINGIRTDNRIANLRECSNAENCQNMRPHRDGAGLLGASWEKRCGKWQSGIGIGGKRVHLGYYATREEAHAAYLQAKQERHNFGGARG